MQTCRPGHPLQKRSEVLLHILSSRWRTRTVSLRPSKASALRWDSGGASQNHVKHTKHVFEALNLSPRRRSQRHPPRLNRVYIVSCKSLSLLLKFCLHTVPRRCSLPPRCLSMQALQKKEQKQVQLKHPDGGHTGTDSDRKVFLGAISAATAESRVDPK